MDRFDYEEHTRQRYQSAKRARRYHSKFAGGDWRQIRSRYVVRREREMLRRMLAPRMPGVVLDVPCGTGKMAPVLAGLGASVVCADISAQMLRLAREEYARLGYTDVDFLVCDAETITSRLDRRSIDVTCCVRLLHRAPEKARHRMLEQFAKASPVTVASYAVTSPLQRLRGRALGKKGWLAERQISRRQIEEELSEYFTVLDARPISRGVCSEWFFLLRSGV